MGIEKDVTRCKMVRETIGYDKTMMMDSNQIWGVNEAIENMTILAQFKPVWIEEPTAPDDILGHKKISESLKQFGIGVATGEHGQNRIWHKQMCQLNAYNFCQTDPCRLGGFNEVIIVLLLARKHNIPVCLHTGGVGLCELGIHASVFDYLNVAPVHENRWCEYVDSLHEHFVYPTKISNGNYVLPQNYGIGLDLKKESIAEYTFPNGSYWKSK